MPKKSIKEVQYFDPSKAEVKAMAETIIKSLKNFLPLSDIHLVSDASRPTIEINESRSGGDFTQYSITIE